MAAVSAGLLLYRRRGSRPEVFLVHPGGPYWAKKDDGAWSVPKGLVNPDEDELACARREFREETGFETAESGRERDLGIFPQPSGKRLHVWAIDGACNPADPNSNLPELVKDSTPRDRERSGARGAERCTPGLRGGRRVRRLHATADPGEGAGVLARRLGERRTWRARGAGGRGAGGCHRRHRSGDLGAVRKSAASSRCREDARASARTSAGHRRSAARCRRALCARGGQNAAGSRYGER